eukprot:SAG11_NODE_691_length_7699_cov_3.868026_3_plen_69_part_00
MSIPHALKPPCLQLADTEAVTAAAVTMAQPQSDASLLRTLEVRWLPMQQICRVSQNCFYRTSSHAHDS